ncbi:PKD domain-containing protein [Flavihumibacter stibioxidans]|uniref:PKD domain-containing protein n=1 Tax=Flavihumibacter stibioxidans TaxID=1834163 RepID=A0ABR7MD90_9BACT|nr:hypothetical protein [Flavihumibacter stibioxidans]
MVFHFRTLILFLCLASLCLLCPAIVSAQVKADFNAGKTGGCAPLVVAFTNTSTGVSPAATYEWQFGNGNKAVIASPSSIFPDEGAYTVTLTVRDGSQTSTISKTIQVFKPPVVDFESSIIKGCFPLEVQFSAKALAGDGDIADYFWDFGDGNVLSTREASISHTFTSAGNRSVSLTVTNSGGCQSTLLKENILQVLPETRAVFSPEKSFICSVSDPVTFVNGSVGPGQLTYTWDFGDGTTSTEKNPSHVFKDKGEFFTKLTVTSSEGCTHTTTLSEAINVANFVTDFRVDDSLCTWPSMQFTNLSTPGASQVTWNFGDGFDYPAWIGQEMYYQFPTPGNHTVTLTNQFGECRQSVSKVLAIRQSPELKGFIMDFAHPCGGPVEVTFRDTTASAVKWEWDMEYHGADSGNNSRKVNYEYQGTFRATLRLKDAYGCRAEVHQYVDTRKPYAELRMTNLDAEPWERGSCGPMKVRFEAVTQEIIRTYLWDFGDGTTSTEASPEHVYTKEGNYRPKLTFTTDKGCTNEALLDGSLAIRDPFKADFTVSATEICGNTPFILEDKTVNNDFMYNYVDFGDGTIVQGYSYQRRFEHKYQEEGVYSVKLISTDLFCADTIVKEALVKVTAPFPRISEVINTCDGTRGLVTFRQNSALTDSWTWDFGDGTVVNLNQEQESIQHKYKNSGWYLAKLTTKRGACTVSDSIGVTVLLKQQPLLTINKSIACWREDHVEFKISNVEKNPRNTGYYFGYSTPRWQHSDGTELVPFSLDNDPGVSLRENTPEYILFTRKGFDRTKKDVQVILYSQGFGCYDTTNIVPISFRGPVADFRRVTPDICKSGNTITIEDLSGGTGNAPIVKREQIWWYGNYETVPQQQLYSREFQWPGSYYVAHKVTDADGCIDIKGEMLDLQFSELKAGFLPSATTISPGSTISFQNNSSSSDPVNTSYQWTFGDGTGSASVSPDKTYSRPGTYQVRLIARNTLSGCADTASQSILVKYINAAFSINASFVSNSSCPPVLVQFTNHSSNASRYSWDFGDGTVVENVFNPSHVYTKPGFYLVTLNTWSDNGTKYTTIDSVRIRSMSADLAADLLRGCTEQTITLSSDASNVQSYHWDFGDGTLAQTTDSFSVHHYRYPGIYTPLLVVTDASGCSASVKLDQQVVIDDLQVTLPNPGASFCAPKQLLFDPVISSITGEVSPDQLSYHWNFGTGNPADTSQLKSPSFAYQSAGTYEVKLLVKSSAGCRKEVGATLKAFQGLGGLITAPQEICEDGSVLFRASTQLPGQPSYNWIFEDGSRSSQQQPPARNYNEPGSFLVKLVVDNNGCSDTVLHQLEVRGKPRLVLSQKDITLCEGIPVSLTVSGAVRYAWSPAAGLNTTSGSEVVVSPQADTRYIVTGTNEFNCSNTDSAEITVIRPFSLQVNPVISVCEGEVVQLSAAGAVSYQWINQTNGLSNTGIANPRVRPDSTITYTVVGTGEGSCFNDTSDITVRVLPLPVIDAGADMELQPGSNYLIRTKSGSNVVSWRWEPSDFLSCTTCPAPETRPQWPITYRVTAATADGCVATDTVSFTVLCNDSRIYIPNAFTPNADGKNEGFRIRADGVTQVNYIMVYNRFGQKVFERKNFQVNDQEAVWDGRFNGSAVPSGAYVYMIEFQCMDQRFQRKGSVVVLY